MMLQVDEAEGWETVAADLGPPDEDLVACTGELRPLPPLGGAQATMHLPSELSPAEYRVIHELEVRGDRRAVTTDAFTVAWADEGSSASPDKTQSDQPDDRPPQVGMSAHRQRDRQRRPPRVRGQQFAWASVVVIVLATTAVIALGAGYGQSVESDREQGRSGATTSGETGTSPEVGVEVDPGTRVGEEQLPRRGGPPRVLITVGLLGLPIAVSIGAALVTDPRRAIVGRTAAVVVLLLWTLLFIASVGVLYAIAAGLMAASAALSRTPVGPDA